MEPIDDPYAERPHEAMDTALDPRPAQGRFRDWLAKSNPVTVLLVIGFILLIVAVIISMVTGYFERQHEDQKTRSELECRSRFTNDVTQNEGLVLLQISRVVAGAVDDNDAAVAKASRELGRLAPQFEEALAKRDVAERVCKDRPAS